MVSYTVRRLLMLIPVLFGVTVLVFLVFNVTSDPTLVILGKHASLEKMAELRESMGLNDPLWVQYGRYVWKLLHGDMGRSWFMQTPVALEVFKRFPHTVELAVSSLILAVLVGITVGVISAVRQYSWFDHAGMIGALLGVSMPIFWLGLILISLFAVKWQILPPSGRGTAELLASIPADPRHPYWSQFYILYGLFKGNWAWVADSLRHLVLPMVALAAHSMGIIARMTRSTMLEVIRLDYIRTARAKGLSERVVVYRHALKNALIPVVTVIGLQFGGLLGGAVLTETVFSWPGVGSLAVSAIQNSDLPLVQGTVLLSAVVFVFANLVVDLAYAFLDPRIHYS